MNPVEEMTQNTIDKLRKIIKDEIGEEAIADPLNRLGETGRRLIAQVEGFVRKLESLAGPKMPDTLDLDPGYFQMCETSKHIPIAGLSFTIKNARWIRMQICERCGLVFASPRSTNPKEMEKDHERER